MNAYIEAGISPISVFLLFSAIAYIPAVNFALVLMNEVVKDVPTDKRTANLFDEVKAALSTCVRSKRRYS